MKDVYLKAAKKVDARMWQYSCDAIFVADNYSSTLESTRAYSEMFRPEFSNMYWGDEWGSNRKQCRVLALLFMHAIENYKEPK